MTVHKSLRLLIILFVFIRVFLAPPAKYPVDPAYACCIGDTHLGAPCQSGYDGCGYVGGVQLCCCGSCCVNCGPSCTTRGLAVYSLPFAYNQGACGSYHTIYTLPFCTDLACYYTIPVTIYYTGE